MTGEIFRRYSYPHPTHSLPVFKGLGLPGGGAGRTGSIGGIDRVSPGVRNGAWCVRVSHTTQTERRRPVILVSPVMRGVGMGGFSG